jgi:hypothetical protein
MAATNGHIDVVLYLLQDGANADDILMGGVQENQAALVAAAVAGTVTRQGLLSAMNLAGTLKREALATVISDGLIVVRTLGHVFGVGQ